MYNDVRVVAPVLRSAPGFHQALIFRDFKDTVSPFFESDTLFLECRLY